MSWPWLFSSRGWKNSCWAPSHSQERHTYRQHLHRWSHINFLNEVPFRQVAIYSSHKVDQAVAEEDDVYSAIKISQHLMALCRNFNCINKIYFIWVDSFILTSGLYSAHTLNLGRQLFIISTEKGDMCWMTVFEKCVYYDGANGACSSSDDNIESIKMPTII